MLHLEMDAGVKPQRAFLRPWRPDLHSTASGKPDVVYYWWADSDDLGQEPYAIRGTDEIIGQIVW